MNKKVFLALAVLSMTGIFCTVQAGPSNPTPDLKAAVNATLTALAPEAASATLTPVPIAATQTDVPMSSFPDMGTISGTLNYPADTIPALRVAAFELTSGQAIYTDTSQGQNTYTLDLPIGNYHVVAYSLGGTGFPTGLGGGYTQAVPCGLSASCNDHSLITVTVTTGNTTANVDPTDWYADAGTFPSMPTP